MRPDLGAMGMLIDLGWRPDALANMMRACPLKLRCALDRLSCVIKNLMGNRAIKRKLLPDVDDMFDSAQVVRARCRLDPDGSMVAFMNNLAASHYGVHKEEFGARMASQDMPMYHTEYCLLCWQLDLLYQTAFNEADSFDILTPFRMDGFKPSSQQTEQWGVHRWKHTLYANGIASTAVLITAEEFDRGIAQRADAMGVFAECISSGARVYSSHGLSHREQLSSLMASEDGRRVLDALADKVITCFGLDQQQPVPSVVASG